MAKAKSVCRKLVGNKVVETGQSQIMESLIFHSEQFPLSYNRES